jgi:hypothetical protein
VVIEKSRKFNQNDSKGKMECGVFEMNKEELLELIEQKRISLHNAINEKGLDHPKTLEYSQELDKLIFKFLTLKDSKWKSGY